MENQSDCDVQCEVMFCKKQKNVHNTFSRVVIYIIQITNLKCFYNYFCKNVIGRARNRNGRWLKEKFIFSLQFLSCFFRCSHAKFYIHSQCVIDVNIHQSTPTALVHAVSAPVGEYKYWSRSRSHSPHIILYAGEL